MTDEQTRNAAALLFGGRLQERYDDPEVQGGKISLIEVDKQSVQKPLNSLDHMRSSLMKQVAYNQRVFKAEEAIAGINCDVADFLPGMNPDPADPVIVCVNTGESMKRNEQAV
jgi:hypothetical protein